MQSGTFMYPLLTYNLFLCEWLHSVTQTSRLKFTKTVEYPIAADYGDHGFIIHNNTISMHKSQRNAKGNKYLKYREEEGHAMN